MKKVFTLLLIANLIIIGSNKAQNTPVAVNDTFYIDYSDYAKTVTYNRSAIIYNDSDIDGNALIIDTIFYNGVNTVTIQNHPSGWLRVYRIFYTVPPSYSGKDSITYYLTDNGSPTGFDTATIYIYVKRKPFEKLDLNNISATIHKNVLFQSNDSVVGFNVPKNSSFGTIYASNLWVAGEDINGNTRVSASTFHEVNSRGNAGPIMDSINYTYYNYQWDRVWKVSAIDIQNHIAGMGTTEAITNWPAHGDTSLGQALNLAPFIDTDGDGIYNPLLGDYPKIKGQQTIYFIQNDKRDTIEPNILRIGIEIHGMAYSFNCPEDSALNNTIFVNYKVYNRSASPLFNAYIGLWSDIDIGNPNDDYFASDVARGSFYGYNNDGFDETIPYSIGYGANPPAQSVTFLKGPKKPNDGLDNPLTNNVQDAIDSSGIPYQGLGIRYGDGIVDNEFMGLTRFLTYSIDTLGYGYNEPEYSSDYYNYLKGIWENGAQMTWGGDGIPFSTGGIIPTNYIFPGDSDPLFWSTQGVLATPSIWTDVIANETRGVGSCGPFTFMPDSIVELDLAFVFARNYTDTSNTAAIPIMQNRIDVVRNYFLNGFENLCPEIIPVVEDTLLDSLVVTVPNVFTPNNDGFNDNFVIQIQSAHLLKNIDIGVFNRWGQYIDGALFNTQALSKLPTTNNQQQITVWDGRTNTGNNAPSGTYYYILKYKTIEGETKSIKGFLSLLR